MEEKKDFNSEIKGLLNQVTNIEMGTVNLANIPDVRKRVNTDELKKQMLREPKFLSGASKLIVRLLQANEVQNFKESMGYLSDLINISVAGGIVGKEEKTPKTMDSDIKATFECVKSIYDGHLDLANTPNLRAEVTAEDLKQQIGTDSQLLTGAAKITTEVYETIKQKTFTKQMDKAVNGVITSLGGTVKNSKDDDDVRE